jgi:hypothetical protein
MTHDARPLIEAVLQQLLEMRVAIREREKAVARVSRRQHAVLLPQATRASAVVSDSHDPGDGAGIGFTLLVREFGQPFEDRRKPGAAAERDDAVREWRIDGRSRGMTSGARVRPVAKFVTYRKSHVYL